MSTESNENTDNIENNKNGNNDNISNGNPNNKQNNENECKSNDNAKTNKQKDDDKNIHVPKDKKLKIEYVSVKNAFVHNDVVFYDIHVKTSQHYWHVTKRYIKYMRKCERITHT